MKPIREPLCLVCRRYDPLTEDPPRCQSFPRGIPDEVYLGLVSHVRSFAGEQPFDGTIPVGWENRGPSPADGEDLSDVQREAATWSPARRIERS